MHAGPELAPQVKTNQLQQRLQHEYSIIFLINLKSNLLLIMTNLSEILPRLDVKIFQKLKLATINEFSHLRLLSLKITKIACTFLFSIRNCSARVRNIACSALNE